MKCKIKQASKEACFMAKSYQKIAVFAICFHSHQNHHFHLYKNKVGMQRDYRRFVLLTRVQQT